MRARLAKAAYEVIAKRGHSAFRTAAVAKQAGVSQGAQTHHFPTKDSLTLAAIDYAFATSSERSSRIAKRAEPPDRDPIELMIADFREFFMGDEFWVALDITIDESKNRDLAGEIRPLVARYRKPIYDKWVEILSQRGWSTKDAEKIVRMTGAMVAGFGMRTLWEDVETYLPHLLADWQKLIARNFPREDRGIGLRSAAE